MRKVMAAVVCLLAVAGMAGFALADGCYIPPEDEGLARLADMTSPDQHVILVDRGDTQEMVVRVVVRGAPQEFAWILPLPAPPSQPVETFDLGDDLFGTLYFETQPRWVEAEDIRDAIDCGAKTNAGGDGGESESVELLGRQVTGDLLIATLAADSGAALENWLTDNRFLVPDGLGDLAQDYVDDGWVFLAIKMVSGFEDDDARLQVLHITWKGDAPVFPMRLTRLNAADTRTHVTLFSFSQDRTTVPGMKTRYADIFHGGYWIDPWQERALESESPEGEFLAGLEDKYWITRLERSFGAGDMEDLHPVATAPERYQEVRTYARAEPRGSRLFLGALAAVLVFALAFLVMRLSHNRGH